MKYSEHSPHCKSVGHGLRAHSSPITNTSSSEEDPVLSISCCVCLEAGEGVGMEGGRVVGREVGRGREG